MANLEGPPESEAHTRSETNTQKFGCSGKFYKTGQYLAESSSVKMILMSEKGSFSRKKKLHIGESCKYVCISGSTGLSTIVDL